VVEYAWALAEVGALRESLRRLEALLATDDPPVATFLLRARLCFMAWDFEGAGTWLHRHATHASLDGVQKIMSAVHEADAVLTVPGDARAVLARLSKLALKLEREREPLFATRAWLATAQGLFMRGRGAEAHAALERSRPQVERVLADRLTALWSAWEVLTRPRPDPGDLRRVLTRLEAADAAGKCRFTRFLLCRALGDAAGERECLWGALTPDFWRLAASWKLAPSEGATDQSAWDRIPRDTDGRRPAGTGPLLDLTALPAEGALTAPVRDSHGARALRILASECLAPTPLGTLHELLYLSQNFDPWYSPPRIHQVIRRLRRWLESQKLPLAVVHSRGGYRMVATGPCVIRLPLPVSQRDQAEAPAFPPGAERRWALWLAACGDRTFRAQDYAQAVGVSARQAQLDLRRSVALGRAKREGAARAARYRLCPGQGPGLTE
jgi:hypothetical protein